MKCPIDNTKLNDIDFRGIKLGECAKCRGKWFGRDELKKLIERTDPDLVWINFDAFEDEDKFATTSEGLTCPNCGRQMDSMTYKNSKVVIDLCRDCRGVWLDRNEFEKIVRFLERMMWGKPSGEYSAELEKHFIEAVMHPSHLLAELKDLFVVLKLLELREMSEHPSLTAAIEAINRYSPFK